MPEFRIAMLSVHTGPLATLGGKETGGMNVYVRDLTRALIRRGHRVDVYTRAQDPELPIVRQELGAGARVIYVPAGPEHPYHKNLVYDHLPEFVAGVRARAEAEGITYDVLHSHYWLSGAVAQSLRRAWDVPVVHMFHTLGEMKNTVAQRSADLETARRIVVEKEIVEFADALVAATPAERRQLIELYDADPDRIHVISPGVDTGLFCPIPPEQARAHIALCPERRIIMFVGRIEPLKGIDNLLRAIARVLERRPELRAHICVPIIGGDPNRIREDDEMIRLQTLREELNIEDVVLFLGAKDQDLLPYYYSAADVVVMPSDYESFGMVALEAMACGTPVIASDVGGLAFLIKDERTGYRVPARDPEALATKIARLLTDEGLRRRIGHWAACWAESYAWMRIAREIEALYQEVVSPAPVELPTCVPCP
jgi:D-inositol-3-phosphate glycosyltransferase